MPDEMIEITGDTHELIGKMAKVAQEADEIFETVALNCDDYNYGGCRRHGDNCLSLNCPLAKEKP